MTVAAGVPWFLWVQADPSDGGVNLETGRADRYTRQTLVVARREGGCIVRVGTFAVAGDSPQARALCVTPDGWMAFWTETRDNTVALVAGTDAGETRVIQTGRIWEAAAAVLADGTVLLGLILIEGRTPQLRFHRVERSGGVALFPCAHDAVAGPWSLSLAPAGGSRCWLAFDEYADNRLRAVAGCFDAATGRLRLDPLPGTGFATQPSIAPLTDGAAGLAWTEDKAWGCQVYDFKRDTRLKYAEYGFEGLRLCEDVPVPAAAENDDQLSPSAPALVALDDGVHLFYRRLRTAIRSADGLVNDWGWQIHATVRSQSGLWTAPSVFSHDVGNPDDPPRVAATSGSDAAMIYHACSFDAMRSVNHGSRLHLALLRGGGAAPAATLAPHPGRDVAPAIRPRLAVRPMIEVGPERLHCFWGDLHRHAHVSKCIPEHDGGHADHVRFALAARAFDFYSLTDHDIQITDREWERWMGLCACVGRDGDFVAIPGFEGPNHTVQGHVNTHFRDREAAAFGFRTLRHLATLPEVYDACRRAGMTDRIFFVRHFHADKLRYADLLEGPGRFDPAFNWSMEVVQGRGFSPKTAHELLAAGFRFGFVGGTDHNRPPGHPRGGVGIYEQAITGVWGAHLGHETLFDAFRRRRTFCTNGPQLAAAIWVNEAFMGDAAAAGGRAVIRVSVQPTTELRTVTLIRDGELIATRTAATRAPSVVTFEDTPDRAVGHYYYAVIEQTPEPGLDYPGLAWTSPVWVKA
jgi:hypothetical protein